MTKGWLKAEFDRVRALTATAPWVVVTRPLVNGRRITQPGESKAEAEAPRKSDLPPGTVAWIGYRMAVKRAGEPEEGYAWRWVDTGELVDFDTVHKCMWTLTDPAAS